MAAVISTKSFRSSPRRVPPDLCRPKPAPTTGKLPRSRTSSNEPSVGRRPRLGKRGKAGRIASGSSDIFGGAVQRLAILFISRVAESASGLVVFGVRGPAAIQITQRSGNRCLIACQVRQGAEVLFTTEAV